MTVKTLINKNEKKNRFYVSEKTGKLVKVYCNYVSYLFLKQCYSKTGLTINQYNAYKKYCCK